MDSKEYSQVYSKLTSLKDLPLPKDIRSLNFSHNHLPSYESLKAYKELRSLNLEDNKITSIAPLESPSLFTLNLGFNSLMKIEMMHTTAKL